MHYGKQHHYFELEYVLGKNLRQKKVTAPGKHLSENIVKWLGIQILEALEYAHNNNVIHRDLKPQNVVLTPDGIVKLIDFGISETLRACTSLVWDTIPQTTVLYMSPEQLQGKQISLRSDLYSLAATMYDLVSGKPPFFSGDIYNQILKEEPQPIPGISDELNNILLKGLSKEPLERYSQCAEMKTELEKIIPPARKEAPAEKAPAKIVQKQKPKKEVKPKRARARFRFFSLNPTLKYSVASLVVVLLVFLLSSKLPDFIKRTATKTDSSSSVEQDTFKLRMARALKLEADAKYNMRLFVSPPGNNALELYRKALQANPADSSIVIQIDKIRQKFLNDASVALTNNQFQAALSIINDGLHYFPEDHELLQLNTHSGLIAFSELRIRILNGVGVAGLASRLSDYLGQNDFTVTETENFQIEGRVSFNETNSRLFGNIPENSNTQRLSVLLGIPYNWSDSDQSEAGNVTLVLGKDYRNIPLFSDR